MSQIDGTEEEMIKSFNDKEVNLLNKEKSNQAIFIIKMALRILVASILAFVIIFIIVFNIKFKKEKEKEPEYEEDDRTVIDIIPLEELNNARKNFNQFKYTDTVDSSKILNYNLFIPKEYDDTQSKKYPLVVFIGDLSTLGSDVTYPINQTVGGPIWATDTVQKYHNCFVLVPQYTEVIIDDRNGYTKSEYINVTVRLINKLVNEYKIDQNKIYGTGQSMGAMTTLYLLANNQNLYAAGLIVDGQWIKEELLGLANATFTYFAAGGDEKAFNGQKEIKQYLNSLNINYGELTELNATEEIRFLNIAANQMFKKGYSHNFITYKNGSVFPYNCKKENEHLASFKYGYRIEEVLFWIFKQNKVKCDEGLFYSQDGKCSLTNFCYKTKKDNSCSECIYGYYLSSDKSCTNDINCQKGNKENGLCTLCYNGYYLDLLDNKCKSNKEEFFYCKVVNKGICTTCEDFHYFDQDNKCTISDNCITSEKGLCTKCKDGYHLGLDSKCIDVEKCIYSTNNQCTECEDGFYYDVVDKLCKKSENNFQNCRINSEWGQDECAYCKNNFYINQLDHLCYDNTEPGPFYKCQISNNMGTFCQLCVDGYYIGNIDFNCTKIEGCLKSLDEETCLVCNEYYCMDNLGNCTDNSYVISEDKKYYFRCKMLNEDGTKCQLCDHSINTTDEGICYDDYHCIKDKNGKCVKCQKENQYGYPTYCFNEEFGCIDSFLDNCIKCNNIFDMDVCTECEEGYEIDEYGDCTEI